MPYNSIKFFAHFFLHLRIFDGNLHNQCYLCCYCCYGWKGKVHDVEDKLFIYQIKIVKVLMVSRFESCRISISILALTVKTFSLCFSCGFFSLHFRNVHVQEMPYVPLFIRLQLFITYSFCEIVDMSIYFSQVIIVWTFWKVVCDPRNNAHQSAKTVSFRLEIDGRICDPENVFNSLQSPVSTIEDQNNLLKQNSMILTRQSLR